MYTQCPDCLTVFSLEAQALAQARGRMVCGHCQASFDALPRLTDQLPPEPIGRLPSHAPSNELPIVISAVYRPWLASLVGNTDTAITPPAPPQPPSDSGSGMLPAMAWPATTSEPRDGEGGDATIGLGALFRPPPTMPDDVDATSSPQPPSTLAVTLDPATDDEAAPPIASAAATDDSAAATTPAPLPSSGREEDFSQLQFTPTFVQSGRRRRRWPWLLLCLLLALLLGGQLAWAERQSLVSSPLTGPWLRGLCNQLGCHLPLVADLHQLRLLARDVQSHPSASGALMISATLRNEAGFAQPYPVIDVTLSDVNGKKLAMRRLQPADYLDDTAAMRRGIRPGSNVAVVLEVEDPGPGAVAFELGFQ